MFYEIAKLFAENYKKRLNSIRNILSPTSSAQNTPLFVLTASKKCSSARNHNPLILRRLFSGSSEQKVGCFVLKEHFLLAVRTKSRVFCAEGAFFTGRQNKKWGVLC